MRKIRGGTLSIVALLAACAVGCNPFSMGFLTPIPVPPWTAEKIQEKYENKNDHRVPIMPPIRNGFPPPMCEDPPSDLETLRTMHRVARGCPMAYEEFRDDIRIVKERLVDKIDPPRFFPLVGPAQLHHCHWKCIIYYTEIIESDYPFPVKIKKRRVQVIYIDKDHLHLYVGSDPETQKQVTQDLTRY